MCWVPMLPRVEDADLQVRMPTQARNRTHPVPELEIVDKKPNVDAAIGCRDQPAQEQIPDRIRIPQVVLEVECSLGPIDQSQASQQPM
jgi:hypothetical protein